MRKLTLCISTAILLLTCLPVSVKAIHEAAPAAMIATKPDEGQAAAMLLARLDEIKAMDMSTLVSAEKKQLRKEVRAIKSELRSGNSGIYLSIGAILIIILLLVLLL